MSEFVPGLELCRAFYHRAVMPILDEEFPGLRYSAALIGSGSEVLGFDTPMSTDHHWGPRAMLFLKPEDYGPMRDAIRSVLAHRLPRRFLGYPTNFSVPDPADHGTQLLIDAGEGPVNHRVEIFTVSGFFLDYLAVDIGREPDAADWLTLPQHKLLSITSGAVFHDDLGLDAARDRFRWYPHDIWLYLLAAAWARIGQEEHIMGRAGYAGDELGSALIGARLVRDIMRLCFLLERRYAPYAKWFGTAFRRLDSATSLLPTLHAALAARDWQARQESIVPAYGFVARLQNSLGLTDPLPIEPTPFFGRPFLVIWGGHFADALLARIEDPAVLRITRERPIGNIDLFSDNTDLLEDAGRRQALRGLYG